MRLALVLLLCLALAGCAATQEEPAPSAPSAPYAGEEARAIKALAPEDIEGYRTGAGLGYAKSAELNHYPGPLHALAMADELELSESQRREIALVREQMLEEAVPLGEAYLRAEADIEEAFRRADVTADELRALVLAAAQIEGELRFVHLDAHITTRALMTPEQVAKYDAMRGYTGEGAHEDGAHGHG